MEVPRRQCFISQNSGAIFKFLMGLNKDLDDVRGGVMGTKPLPSLREVFSKVRCEESRKKVMMDGQHSSPTLEGSAFVAYASRPPFQ